MQLWYKQEHLAWYIATYGVECWVKSLMSFPPAACIVSSSTNIATQQGESTQVALKLISTYLVATVCGVFSNRVSPRCNGDWPSLRATERTSWLGHVHIHSLSGLDCGYNSCFKFLPWLPAMTDCILQLYARQNFSPLKLLLCGYFCHSIRNETRKVHIENL